MTSLETKVVERIATCLKEFDTYEIYRSLSDTIEEEMEDKEARNRIMVSYQNSMDYQSKKIREAQGWLTELLNNK